ncbi:hypothetical protein GUITHDRAFT_48649, partial [Guillardia theta CCMP2712]
DDDVAVLNGRNFETVAGRAPHMLVEFYAPWCGHCQKFEPIYQKVASHMRMEKINVMLAKVNAIEEPTLSQSMGVMGFPSLYWYAYGRMRSYEGGKRNSSMVEWISFHARRDAVHVVHSNREAEDLLEAMGAEEAVIGRFLHHHSVEAMAFMIAAEEDDTSYPNSSMPYVMVLEARGLGPPKWHQLPPERRYALFDADRIKSFVATYRMPRVVELTGKVWRRVLQSPVRNQTLLFSDPFSPGHEQRMAAFAAVAEEWFGKVLFLQISSNFTSVLKYFGLTASDFPAVVVAVAGHEETDKGEMYRLDQSRPQFNLTTLPKGNLEEDVIYPDDPVRKLTGEELEQVVMDPDKDVLVKFFAPWCGHCQAMRTAYMEVSDAFEEHPDLVIAEFDATAHKLPAGLSIEGYPTLRMWPAERGNSTRNKLSPLDYQGPRTTADISAFVRRHSVRLK